MTYINKMEIFGSFGLVFISILAIILFHEFGKKTITDAEASILMEEFYQHEYDSVLVKIQSLNISDSFTKDSVLKYNCNSPYYGIWGDIKSQEKNNAIYELKGGFSPGAAKHMQIQWRYYIKTENNKIVSIKKG